jgi:hypothetical protein
MRATIKKMGKQMPCKVASALTRWLPYDKHEIGSILGRDGPKMHVLRLSSTSMEGLRVMRHAPF